MTTRHLNKLLMFFAVQRHCMRPECTAAAASLPAFAESLHSFEVLVERIRQGSRRVIDLNPAGHTVDKKRVREELSQLAARVSASVVTWARKQGDAELAQQGHVTKTTILSGRAIDAAAKVDHLLSVAWPHLAALAPYGLTAERLERLADLNESFSERISRPRSVIMDRKCSNASLTTLIAQASVHLAQLDRLAGILEESHPEFVILYRNSRKIHHTAATRSLSEAEQASKEERKAKQAVIQAKKDARIASIRANVEANRAKAQSILSAISKPDRDGSAQREAPARPEFAVPYG